MAESLPLDYGWLDLLCGHDTETCPECLGKGYIVTGHGHFGDCSGDAGEAWKPCISPCDECLGRGQIVAK